MSVPVPQPKIFACTQSMDLGERIAKAFGSPLGKVKFSRYSDGEFQPSFEESVRGSRVFLVGSTHPNSEHLMELLLMIDAAKELQRGTSQRYFPILDGRDKIARISLEFRSLLRWLQRC